MGVLGDIGGGLFGGIAGLFSDDGSGEAKSRYDELAKKYGALDPRIGVEQATNDPAARAGLMDALSSLQQQYRSGGLDAIGKSQIAGAETEANRQATARENAIQEQARAGNMGNSGVTLALKQQAGQNAGQEANRAALGAAGLAQQNRLGALGAAGQIAGRMGDQANAISQYNAAMRLGAGQQTFNNRMAQLGGQGGAYGAAYGAQQNADDRTRAQWTGIGKGVGGIGDMIAKGINPAMAAAGGG